MHADAAAAALLAPRALPLVHADAAAAAVLRTAKVERGRGVWGGKEGTHLALRANAVVGADAHAPAVPADLLLPAVPASPGWSAAMSSASSVKMR